MINTHIVSGIVIPQANTIEDKPATVEAKSGALSGRKIFVTTRARAIWIAGIASAIIVAAGIALIATLTTGGGIAVIALGLGVLACSATHFFRTVLGNEHAIKEKLSNELGCNKNLDNLPEFIWGQTAKIVKIKITKEQIEAVSSNSAQGFIPPRKGFIQSPPFVLEIVNKNNQKWLNAYVFDREFKTKTFVLDVADLPIILDEGPFFPKICS